MLSQSQLLAKLREMGYTHESSLIALEKTSGERNRLQAAVEYLMRHEDLQVAGPDTTMTLDALASPQKSRKVTGNEAKKQKTVLGISLKRKGRPSKRQMETQEAETGGSGDSPAPIEPPKEKDIKLDSPIRKASPRRSPRKLITTTSTTTTNTKTLEGNWADEAMDVDVDSDDDEFADADYESENDEDDGYFDFDDMSEDHDKSTAMDEHDLVVSEQAEESFVADICRVSRGVAAILLRTYKYDKQRLVEAYSEDPEAVLAGAGISSDGLREGRGIIDNTCCICFDEFKREELFALKCGHGACVDCWRSFLELKIREGDIHRIGCPAFKCNMVLGDDDVRLLVTDAQYERYQKFLTKHFVKDKTHIKWCPAPGCNLAVNVENAQGTMVTCKCGFQFCCACMEPNHAPALCDQVRLWKKKCQDDSETYNWISVNTKDCPKCVHGDSFVSLRTGLSVRAKEAVDLICSGSSLAVHSFGAVEGEDSVNGGTRSYGSNGGACGSKPVICVNASASAGFDNGKRECCRLELVDGTHLTLTPDHRVRILKRSLASLEPSRVLELGSAGVEWVEAGDLCWSDGKGVWAGDRVVCSLLRSVEDSDESDCASSWRMKIENGSLSWGSGSCTLKLDSSNLSGCLDMKGGRERLLAFSRACGGLFALRMSGVGKSFGAMTRFGRERLREDSQFFWDGMESKSGGPEEFFRSFLRLLSNTEGGRRNAFNMFCVGSCPRSMIREFLSAFIGVSGEGGFTFNDEIGVFSCPMTAVVLDFVRLFDEMGIQAERDCMEERISLSGNAIVEFAKTVGIRYSVEGLSLLSSVCSYLVVVERSSVVDDFPCDLGDLTWKTYCALVGIGESSGQNVAAVPLIKCENVGIHQVYDLSVPRFRSFIANGISVHNCHSCIEKNGGCNHITCKSCSHQWCWVCLHDWGGHQSYYSCNRFDPAKKGDEAKSKQKQSLERYLHYYHRFKNHEKSLKVEGQLRASVQKKIERLHEEDPSWVDVQFLMKAVKQLSACRLALQWTYVFAYYLQEGAEKNLFEFLQQELEATTERLSELLEGQISSVVRIPIIDTTRLADAKLRKLLDGVEAGLIPTK